MRIWLILIILISACSSDSSKIKSGISIESNCKQIKIKIPKKSERVDSLVYVMQIFKDDTTKFILCNNKFSDIDEQADHILIWNSRPIKKYENSFKHSFTKTVLNSDSIRQIDYFAELRSGTFIGLGVRLMLNKNTKKIYVNNAYLLSNKFITLEEWCKWDDMPPLPE